MAKYQPEEYWEKRLAEHSNLTGVGHISFDENYNKYLYKLKESTLKLVLKKYQVEVKNKNILDVGSGTGFFIDFYSKLGARSITGIDIAPKSIENLKKKYPNFKFKMIDISSKDVPLILKNEYDIINVFDVLYHIIDRKRFENAINNIGKMIKNGGYIFITDVFDNKNTSPADHVRFRSLDSYKKLLRPNNVEILDIQPMYHLMNKSFTYVPISFLNGIAPLLYKMDSLLNRLLISNSNNLKIIVCIKYIDDTSYRRTDSRQGILR